MDQPVTKPKRGGKRAGAGRPPGKAALPYGASSAIKGLRHRVPNGTPEPLAEVADEAFDAIVKVMRGEVHYTEAQTRLRAAKDVREEICGPVAQKHEVAGADGKPLAVSIVLKGPK